MAENGRDNFEQPKTAVDKDTRVKYLKERQNEERQKKLEEIRAQAIAAQRFKEQKEQERRRRLDEHREREDSRRQQVEERKRAINDAERDRLESILKRNMQREARIEAKKRNERSNIVFAFGSSTPRMLDPTDMTASFWGYRRATSTQNITCSATSLTRRQSERDLDIGSKKRATSASGLERSGESSAPTTPAGCVSGYVGRRRTDLVPTIPTRDASFTSSRKSLSQSPASSRPSSSLSQQSTNSVTSSVSVRHRPSATARRPRPASIAITGVSQDLKLHHNDKSGETTKPPLPRRRKSISKTQVKNPVKSPVDSTPAKAISNNTNPNSNGNGCKANSVANDKANKDPGETQSKPPDTISNGSKEIVQTLVQIQPEISNLVNEIKEVVISEKPAVVVEEPTNNTPIIVDASEKLIMEPINETVVQSQNNGTSEVIADALALAEHTMITSAVDNKDNSNDMTSSMSKPRITTEEEAKAALAERRRLAREEAERLAEQKRLQIEMEEQAERERQQREEEQLRLIIEQQKAAEQERLEEAIKEAQKREEEERLRKEEKLRLKQQKEEQAREEAEKAEKLKVELQEKLKNEEKEREERRKRIEAIMSRTRGKNNANSPSQQNSEDKNENKSDNENKMNGGTKTGEQENGTTKNGKEIEIVDNIIPDETLKNANTTIDTLNSTDSINSNNSWQTTQQFDSLM